MNPTQWLLAITALILLLAAAFWIGYLIDLRVNPPSLCFDCRNRHHDHDIESGTCRRPDCRCKA